MGGWEVATELAQRIFKSLFAPKRTYDVFVAKFFLTVHIYCIH